MTAILPGVPQNLAASEVDGIDMEVVYDFRTDLGDWDFFLNGTYLTTYTEQPDPSSPVQDLLNTFGNPVDLKLRGGVNWNSNAFAAGLYVNYIDDYTDDQTSSGEPVKINSRMTVDVSLRVDLGEMIGGDIAENASVRFNATNLLNEDPPAIGDRVFSTPFYDGANADPIGRRIGILLTKQW